MNFGELTVAALGDSFDATKYRPRVQRWLNEAQRKIARRVRFDEMDSIVITPVAVGATTVTLEADPSVLERVSSVHWLTADGAPFPMDPVELDELEDYKLSDVGLPDVYCKLGGGLEFRPAAATAGQVRARVTLLPAKLTVDTDVPQLHEDYHDMMVTFARARCYRDEDDLQMHDGLMQQYEAEMQRLKVDAQGANEDGPRQIEGTF